MKKQKPSTRDSEAQDSLLGDLESIRTLLDRTAEPTPIPDDSNDVPMLEDMVEGAFTVNESVLTSRASFDDEVAAGSGKSGLADDTIKALLGDQWRAQARKILSDARSTAEGSGAGWSAEQMNALNESLKVRIDRTLDDWLVDMMNSRIDDLRTRLLAILEHELTQFTRALTDEEQDGK
jgi:hypothetical protein